MPVESSFSHEHLPAGDEVSCRGDRRGELLVLPVRPGQVRLVRARTRTAGASGSKIVSFEKGPLVTLPGVKGLAHVALTPVGLVAATARDLHVFRTRRAK